MRLLRSEIMEAQRRQQANNTSRNALADLCEGLML
jgi:hypothetical protein